mmetsp:Transcript_13905/g.36811  ORF Transcript_13905/g.36811 Transcript_13905/m.36811 type:complete len:95 (+) Transcript_13905:132-416(+)
MVVGAAGVVVGARVASNVVVGGVVGATVVGVCGGGFTIGVVVAPEEPGHHVFVVHCSQYASSMSVLHRPLDQRHPDEQLAHVALEAACRKPDGL